MIPASPLLLMLVIGWTMLSYKKKYQANLFSMPLLKDICPKYKDLVLLNCFTVAPQNLCPWPRTGFSMTAQGSKYVLGCFATAACSICFPYLFLIPTSKEECSLRVISLRPHPVWIPRTAARQAQPFL